MFAVSWFTPSKYFSVAVLSGVSLVFSGCIDVSVKGPSASAPLNPVTGQSFVKVFGDGTNLSEDAVTWSCVKDSNTGLVWERKVEDSPGGEVLRASSNLYSWSSLDSGYSGGVNGALAADTNCDSSIATCDAASYVQAVNDIELCGRDNWRLPTQEELLTILDREQGINSIYFDNHNAVASYWTTNTVVQEAMKVNAYTIDFSVGGSAIAYSAKDALNAVRLVSGGWARTPDSECFAGFYAEKPDAIYDDASDSEGLASTLAFVDKQTGLMWLKAEQAASDWSAAQTSAVSADDLGYTDWRLANVTELLSLVDRGCATPTTNGNYFSSINGLWSSTEDAGDASSALLVEFSAGQDSTELKSASNPYLLVRKAY